MSCCTTTPTFGLASQLPIRRDASEGVMTLEERLRAILASLPDGASITLPVQLLSEWLDDGDYDPLSDFTVAQVATQLGRSPGTVRAWTIHITCLQGMGSSLRWGPHLCDLHPLVWDVELPVAHLSIPATHRTPVGSPKKGVLKLQ